MSKKVALVAFNGEPMCFVHVLLNALDFSHKGYDTKVIIEGSATKLIGILNDDAAQFSKLYREVRDNKLIDCVCQACAVKMEALDAVKEQSLPLCNDMNGHPGLEKYVAQGYTVITF